MNKLLEGYLTIDYRKGIIKYSPCIYKIRIEIFPDDEGRSPLTKLFFSQNAVEKLRWIVSYLTVLNQQAEIICTEEARNTFTVIVAMAAQHFPVTNFAKNFNISKIIKEDIKEMGIIVSTLKEVEILSEQFHIWLNQPEPKCNISIGSIDPQGEYIIKEDIIELPAQVITKEPLSLLQ